MKEIKMLTIAVVLMIISISIWWWLTMRITTNFATEALLEFHWPSIHNPDVSISVVIVDESDIVVLQEILRGVSLRDTVHCGFSADISITMTNGRRSIMFCLANDGCPILRIDDSNRYIRISYEDIRRLHEIFERYGAPPPPWM